MEDDQWSLRTCLVCVGLGKVAVGGSIMAYAFRIADISDWAGRLSTFGTIIVTSGLVYLSSAWNMDNPPPNTPKKNLARRVGIRCAENERGDPDLAGDVAGARPANFGAGESRAGPGGLLRRRKPVQQDIVCEDQEIGDNNEFGPGKASEEVGQADDVEESDQDENEGELGQDADESESSNVVNKSALSKNVGEGGASK